MLKEELEKNLGFKVSDTFYYLANTRYMEGNWRNNYEFCGELKQDELLIRALQEREFAITALGEVGARLHQILRTLNKQIQ